jgi:hypothetical protein
MRKMMNLRRLGIKATVFVSLLGPSRAFAQQQSIFLFSDKADYQHFLSEVPKSSAIRPDANVVEAHFNYGLGAQFNTPVSLRTIVCDQTVARNEITNSISAILTHHGYSLGSGWDRFGFLKATKVGAIEIVLSSTSYEEIELEIKVDQNEFGERAIALYYQVVTYLRMNDSSTRQDRTSERAVERYMDRLRGEMRQSAEAALKANCVRNTVSGITTTESGIQKAVSNLKLTQVQEQQLRLALRKNDDN